MSSDFISLQRCLQLSVDSYLPSELLQEISKWDKILKSPYGFSYYNAKAGWGYKEHASLRVADHWNFTSAFNIHCKTTTPVPDGKWALGKFNGTIQKYEILKVVNPSKVVLKDTFYYSFYSLDAAFNKAINNNENYIQEIQKSFLKKYYSLLEKFSINPDTLVYA